MAEPSQDDQRPTLPLGEIRADHALGLVLKVLENPSVKAEPVGTYVIVNLGTGEYVTAPKLVDANDMFQRRFPEATGFAHRVGEPLYEPLWD
jgi:hypothetical protein